MTTILFLRPPLPEAIRFPMPDRTGGSPSPRAPSTPERSSLRAAIREGWRRWRSRTALAELDPYILKDIGVTPTEAWYEARKPFWRA